MYQKDISIIGAGIGGLTMGLIMKQKEIPFVLYESTAKIKPVGAGIVMANNAMQIFRKAGIHQKIENAGQKVTTMKITDERLRSISTIQLSGYESKYGVHNVAIHRANLQNILAQEIGPENIQLSKRLSSITKEEQYVLCFEDGTSALSESIIAADGIRSTVRNQLFHTGTIRDTKQICWRGVCSGKLTEKYHHEAYEAWGKGKRFGFVKINEEQIYWYAVVNSSLIQSENTALTDIFGEFHSDITDFIAQTPVSSVYQSPIIDLKPVSQWVSGNACLIGDAAHATTPNMGQGACQAIEDAYVLGELLGKGLSIKDSFIQYQQMRLKKAHTIVNNSWMLGKIAHLENSIGVKIRNTLMKITPPSANYKQLDNIFNIDYF